MTREEALDKLKSLRYCLLWPGNWDDIGFTERPIRISSKGYGYLSDDEPCNYTVIRKIPMKALKSFERKILECSGFEYEKNTVSIVNDVLGSINRETKDMYLYCDYDRDATEERLFYIMFRLKDDPIVHSRKRKIYCLEDSEGWNFFESEQELLDYAEKNVGYDVSTWEELDSSQLLEWINRLSDCSPELPVELDIFK